MYGVTVNFDELVSLKRQISAKTFKPHHQTHRLGEHLSSFRGQGMSFSEVRHYQAMDDVRHMEWRVTARTGKPHIKVFQEELERPVIIVGDFNPSMYFGTKVAFKSVMAARLAALIGWQVIEEGDKIGALLYTNYQTTELKPHGRKQGILPLLKALTDITMPTHTTQHPIALMSLLPRLKAMIRPGAMIVILSDGYQIEDSTLRQLRYMGKACDIIFYHILDATEIETPAKGCYPISDGAHTLLFDTHQSNVQESYQEACLDRINRLKKCCLETKIAYHLIQPSDNPSICIKHTFPRRHHG